MEKEFYNKICSNINCHNYVIYNNNLIKRNRVPKYCSRECFYNHLSYLNLINRLHSMQNKSLKMKNGDKINITQLNNYFIKQKTQTCEICNKILKSSRENDFAIDHCHKSKKFRGVLCTNCNLILGWYEKYYKEINDYLNDNRGINKYENI